MGGAKKGFSPHPNYWGARARAAPPESTPMYIHTYIGAYPFAGYGPALHQSTELTIRSIMYLARAV